MARKERRSVTPVRQLHSETVTRATSVASRTVAKGERIVELPIGSVHADPAQPRQQFAGIDELALSVGKHGVKHPLVVRTHPEIAGAFMLVSGERRFRAAAAAGLATVPALVRDHETFLDAVIENVARERLSPVEEAQSYQRLKDEHGMTQAQIAESVGRTQSAVSKTLRLLEHTATVREFIDTGQMSASDSLYLLAIEDADVRDDLARGAVREGWSRAELQQQIARFAQTEPRAPRPGRRGASADHRAAATRLADRLTDRLGAEVKVAPRGEAGFAFSFVASDPDEAARIAARLGVQDALSDTDDL
ncbi:ParB/RepB/Spo0J family partition protein [Conexibacter sp. W3-3-2]|uniref:ParB/RepB/Spo0J family partition protein n=1 Tax=Conexibacter sp. W3-3-2 TaxID=2675227 RepID=UPI0012B9EBA9|nr:ParB/RepB/Spo0J family partition protein [Conexibacter sp. W3-3-2]MTD47239.1 ParB/RepB/Spo0J family partition protein [Conexibacter sp. W3-3-2]